MSTVLFTATAASLLAAIPVIARVKREYEGAGVLSDPTVAAVWVLYTAIVAVVVLAAALGAWPVNLPDWISIGLGLALLATGLVLELAGLASMASFRRMSGMQPDRLITDGAYRISRNPQNVGVGLSLAGVALLGESGVALLAVVGFWVVFHIYVGYEEEHLARAFGAEFDRYRRRTPRFLGLPHGGQGPG